MAENILVVIFSDWDVLFCFLHHHYLGVEADFKNGNWRVTDIHNGGLAKETELSEGDILLKIDQQESSKNVLLNKWLIVEQAKSVLV